MRKILAVGLSMVALALETAPVTAQGPADLRAAMSARDSAVAKVDVAAWERFTATAFTVVAEDGVMLTRAERLARFKTQKPSAFDPRTRETITPVGDAYLSRYLSGGLWIIEVWVREGGRWKVLALQAGTAKM